MLADHGPSRCCANIGRPEQENAGRLVFRKAPGHDGIPLDPIKCCKSVPLHPLHEVLCGVGRRELFHNTQEILNLSPSINAKTTEVTLLRVIGMFYPCLYWHRNVVAQRHIRQM